MIARVCMDGRETALYRAFPEFYEPNMILDLPEPRSLADLPPVITTTDDGPWRFEKAENGTAYYVRDAA